MEEHSDICLLSTDKKIKCFDDHVRKSGRKVSLFTFRSNANNTNKLPMCNYTNFIS